jgi:hypothetical protein
MEGRFKILDISGTYQGDKETETKTKRILFESVDSEQPDIGKTVFIPFDEYKQISIGLPAYARSDDPLDKLIFERGNGLYSMTTNPIDHNDSTGRHYSDPQLISMMERYEIIRNNPKGLDGSDKIPKTINGGKKRNLKTSNLMKGDIILVKQPDTPQILTEYIIDEDDKGNPGVRVNTVSHDNYSGTEDGSLPNP